jgi:hypothetical protein
MNTLRGSPSRIGNRIFTVVWVAAIFAVLLMAPPALAEGPTAPEPPVAIEPPAAESDVPPPEPPPEEPVKPVEKKPPFGEYGRWIKFAEKMAMEELELWGASTTLPEGFMVAMFGYGTMRAAERLDQNRKLIDILPVFDIPDPFNLKDGRDFFSFDFNARGTTRGYFLGLSYGITDRVMLGLTTFFADIEITMDPVFTPGTCERLGVATLEEFYRLLEKLGRPRPKHKYKSDPLDWGDTQIFVTWNYFRNDWFSTAITPKLYVPTAHRADPNQALIFALGPDLDIGAAAWGFGLNPVFDFRLPPPADIASISFAAEGALFTQTKRKSPRFYPPNRDVWDYLKAQKVELDFFPDLSDIDDYYYYTPPPWVAVSASIGVGPIGLTYRHGWGFEGSYETNSRGFKQVIDEIGLVGNGDDGRLIATASLPLTPLYIPGLVQLRFEYVTDGRNALVFRDIYQIGAGFVVPIAPPERYRMPKEEK